MENSQNIVLDFTVNNSIGAMLAGQPVAMMPAELAKKLLRSYVKELVNATEEEIIAHHAREIRHCKTVDEAVNKSTSWLQERELIENISREQWDAYEVQPAIEEGPQLIGQIDLRKGY